MANLLTNNQLIMLRTFAEAGGSIVMRGSGLDVRTLNALENRGLIRSAEQAGVDWTYHLTADGREVVDIIPVKPCKLCEGVGGWMSDSDGQFVCGAPCVECGKAAENAEAVEPKEFTLDLHDDNDAVMFRNFLYLIGVDSTHVDGVVTAKQELADLYIRWRKSRGKPFVPVNKFTVGDVVGKVSNGLRGIVISVGEKMVRVDFGRGKSVYFMPSQIYKVDMTLTDGPPTDPVKLVAEGKPVCARCNGRGTYTLPCAGRVLFLCDHDPAERWIHELAPNEMQPIGLGTFNLTIPAAENNPNSSG